jgi:hypothetical protein
MKKLPCLYTKLKDVYDTHGNIILAVDFDDTIYDWKSVDLSCDYVIDLVKRCQEKLNAKVMLFTCRIDHHLDFAHRHCEEVGLKLWASNHNPDHGPTAGKPFYNVLLDDKACLENVCQVLELLLEKCSDNNKSE